MSPSRSIIIMNFRLSSERRYFPNELQNKAINLLVYGSELEKVSASGSKCKRVFLYMDEDIPIHLHVVKKDQRTIIDIRKIDYITQEIRDQKKYSLDNALFLIIQQKLVCLRFSNRQLKELWWQGLMYFIDQGERMKQSYLKISLAGNQLFGQILFSRCDQDGDKLLDKGNLELINKARQNAGLIKNIAGKETTLNYDQFQVIVDQLLKKDELLSLFRNYSSEGLMNKQQMQRFQQIEQKETAAHGLSESYSFEQFQQFIMNESNVIFDPEKVLSHPLTHPLSHYYINSSHNTYLTSHQLIGHSSVAAYIQALLRGCRCLELDCWDGDDGIPIIYHGYTMTTRILFEDVIIALNKFAFIHSEYPLILSLELHCSYQQQELLGEIMLKHFKEQLYRYEELTVLPSPEQLKRKILIKSSSSLAEAAQLLRGTQIKSTPLSPRLTARFEQILVEEEPDPQTIPITLKRQRENNLQLKNLTYNKAVIHPYVRSDAQQLFNNYNDQEEERNMVITTHTNTKHHPKFVASISLFNSDFSFDENRPIWNISSLSEDKIQKHLKSNPLQMSRFLQRNLIRVYPSGTRIDSSNYDPYPSFLLGAQIVALNYQTPDLPMLINVSKFQENQQCGYVLKPDYLRENNVTKCSNDQNQTQLRLGINLISGSLLEITEKQINVSVEISLRGNTTDEKNNLLFKSKIVPNPFNPQFNQLVQFEIADPQSAMILFQVFDASKGTSTLLGQYGIAVPCIREGYRVVPLRDKNLEFKDYSYLFVHILKQ